MKLPFFFLASLVLAGGAARAQDGFEAVRCGGDVRSALLGKKMSDEPVVQIEKRHGDLGLKDLGGDEISVKLNSTSWRICTREYVVLSDIHGTVRDVLLFPEHSKASPEFSAGTCRSNGKFMTGTVIGVLGVKSGASLHDSPPDPTLLGAIAAWRIDEKTAKFVALPAVSLSCPGSIIITQDGGQ